MATTTTIEWTDATWNPVTGCTRISSGCDNCYAERFSERFRGTPGHPFETGFDLTFTRPLDAVTAAEARAAVERNGFTLGSYAALGELMKSCCAVW